jgi:hypothetical protein
VLNLTTIEYLNLPATNAYRYSAFDSDEDDSDEGYYYSDSDSEDINHVRKRSLKPHHNWKSYRLYRAVTHRIRRTWIMVVRTIIPSYRYRRLKNSKRCGICCSSSNRLPLLPTLSGKQERGYKRVASRNDHDVNMVEFFATKTIRPVITLDGPDYDDDMGLDLAVLQEEQELEDDDTLMKSKSRRSSSKAARLLDLTEEEAMLQMQQAQNIPKEVL